MNLKSAITEDMKNAMRSKDMNRLGTIRLLLAAIKQKEVDERIELIDTQVIAIVERMIKQRKDSISQFTTAKRQDLVDQETSELLLLETYLPAQLSEVEILAKVKQTIEATGAVGPQDMGKVIGILKPELAGQADMGKVSALVKAALSAK
ncbi:MAG: GatB/YqeY domain-containing protein [Betaproteobacteria bacterium]|nr:GatB/YqeY domain-containing protein [Betaproteobacteria bacterium]